MAPKQKPKAIPKAKPTSAQEERVHTAKKHEETLRNLEKRKKELKASLKAKEELMITLEDDISELCAARDPDAAVPPIIIKLKEKTRILKSQREALLLIQNEKTDLLATLKEEDAERSIRFHQVDEEIQELKTSLCRQLQKNLKDSGSFRAEMLNQLKLLVPWIEIIQSEVEEITNPLNIEYQKPLCRTGMTREEAADAESYRKDAGRDLRSLMLAVERLSSTLLLPSVGRCVHCELDTEVRQQLRLLSPEELLVTLDCMSYDPALQNILRDEVARHFPQSVVE